MKRYDEKILGLLLDRYEGSLLYDGRNQVNVSIFVRISKAVLPEYFDQTSTAFQVVEEQLAEMERKGLIRLVFGKQKKHIIEKCELCVEKADSVYAYLGRKTRKEKEQEIVKVLERFGDRPENSAIRAFSAYIIEKIKKAESIKAFADINEPAELERICILADAIENNSRECFLREFSISTFRDSKIAERDLNKAVSILKSFCKRIQAFSMGHEMSVDDILAEFDIYRNPSLIMLKGTGSFQMGDSNVSLKSMPGGLGITNTDIEKIFWRKEPVPRKVLTIENLTSFHRWNDLMDDTLCIYLGGFANRSRRDFLKKLRAAYPNALFLHFGDIDCGGFYIWKALCEGTGISFETIRMDRETLLAHQCFCRPLSDHDRRRLEHMKNDPFFAGYADLFTCMLEHNIKLEQECLTV